eukprot:gene3768-6656_t
MEEETAKIEATIQDAKVTELTKETIEVPKSYLEYDLKPLLVGPQKIVFYNAQNPKFYKEVLKVQKPIVKMWLLRKNKELNYVTKRSLEEAFRMNILLENVLIDDLDLVLNIDGKQLNYKGVEMSIEELPQVCIPRFGATVDYFSLVILRQLEQFGVKILNDVKSLEISKDKLMTMQVFANTNIPIPKTMYAKFPIDAKAVTAVFGDYPIILKLASSSQGNGVMQIYNEDNLKDLANLIDKTNPIILQEFIKKSSGKDVRVLVVGDKVVGGMKRQTSAKNQFKSNFHQGGSVKKVPVNEELAELAIEATKTVGLHIAGIDFLLDEDTYKICEINASPGFEGFEKATGTNVGKTILDYALTQCEIVKTKEKKNKKVKIMKEHIDE